MNDNPQHGIKGTPKKQRVRKSPKAKIGLLVSFTVKGEEKIGYVKGEVIISGIESYPLKTVDVRVLHILVLFILLNSLFHTHGF